MIRVLLALAFGIAIGWLARSDAERGRIASWRLAREDRRNEDDTRVLQWLDECGGSVTLETLIGEVRGVGAGRIRDALERLQADGWICSGYPDPESPHQLMYWSQPKAHIRETP